MAPGPYVAPQEAKGAGYFDKVKGTVAGHPAVVIGVIVVLLILVIWLYFFPRCGDPPGDKKKMKAGGGFRRWWNGGSSSQDRAADPDSRGAAEATDSLIDSINGGR